MKREIIIKEKSYVLKTGLKSLLKFEELTGKNAMNFESEENLTNTIILFYCILSANNDNFFYTKEEFIDLIDENNDILESFTEFLVETAKETKENDKKKQKK